MLYSVVTLNYDLVIEKCINRIHQLYEEQHNASPANLRQLPLAKLHGSVDDEVVAPTWNKRSVGKLQTHWQRAHELLSKANHLRILGYSLPVSDSYIKYLLASAAMKSEHLKTIDVVCLDNEGGALQDRYSAFFNPELFRFARLDIANYLFDARGDHVQQLVKKHTKEPSDFDKLMWADFTGLEDRHESMMRGS